MTRLSRLATDDLAAAALAASADAFVAVDTGGIVVAWNPAAESLFGHAAVDVLGSPDPTHPHPDAGARPDDVVRIHRDGTPIHCVITAEVRSSSGGRPAVGLFLRADVDRQRLLDLRNRVSGEFAQATRHDEVVDVARRAIAEAVGSPGAVALEPRRGRFLGTVGIGIDQAEADEVSLPDASGTPWHAAAAGAITRGRMTIGRRELADAIFIPMGSRGSRRVLAMFVGTLAPVVGDDGLVQALSDEIATGLERLALVRELQAKVEVLEATRAVARRAGVDLASVADDICTLTTSLLSCERVGLYLLGADGLQLVGSHGFPHVDGLGERFAQHALARGGSVVVQDVSRSPYVDGPWSADAGADSVMGTTLHVGPKAVGVLVVAHTQVAPRGFTALCVDVGQAAASQAALALENARLFGVEAEQVALLQDLHEDRVAEVAGLAHDFRTPLTGLLGFAQTLRRMGADITGDQRELYTTVMERQARRLISMVDDLLLASRLDHGGLDLDDPVPVDLGSLVAATVAGYDPDRGDRVECVDLPDGIVVSADPVQLERVLNNLIDNAMKYSPPDTPVRIALGFDPRDPTVVVSDVGYGIPANDLGRVFERFHRSAGAGSTIEQASYGLGLYVVRGIVERHGGTVSCSSVEGEGTTMTVRLPPLPLDGGAG